MAKHTRWALAVSLLCAGGAYAQSTTPEPGIVDGQSQFSDSVSLPGNVVTVNNGASGNALLAETFGASGQTYGLFGISHSPDGRGVAGLAFAPNGVTFGLQGVALSPNGTGLFGLNESPTGATVGLKGQVFSSNGDAGVFVAPPAPSARILRGMSDDNAERFSVTGLGQVGVNVAFPSASLAIAHDRVERAIDVDASVSGIQVVNIAHTGVASSALQSSNDEIQLSVSNEAAPSAQFIEADQAGNIRFAIDVDGDVRADGTFTGGGADYADMVLVAGGAASVEPGDVLVIDPRRPRSVALSSAPRSTLVAGIYSTQPGFLGNEEDTDGVAAGLAPDVDEDSPGRMVKTLDVGLALDQVPLALVGIVPAKASAENGAIRPGDLLVTSSTPGHLMRDDAPAVGTVVGKAMSGLAGGRGRVLVLVSLQ